MTEWLRTLKPVILGSANLIDLNETFGIRRNSQAEMLGIVWGTVGGHGEKDMATPGGGSLAA